MAQERLYIVTYDISDPKRWAKVFGMLKGYGYWLQLSVFQCRLTRKRKVELAAQLYDLIEMVSDHILIFDLGPIDKAETLIESLGRPIVIPGRQPVIV